MLFIVWLITFLVVLVYLCGLLVFYIHLLIDIMLFSSCNHFLLLSLFIILVHPPFIHSSISSIPEKITF